MSKGTWKKRTLKLKKNHTWSAKPGQKIFVADKGAVRFNFPENWIVIPTDDCIKLYDRQPPDDDSVIGVSYLRLPPVDWSGLPLANLLAPVLENDTRNVIDKGEIITEKRGGMEIAWAEIRFLDKDQNREAFSRICLARDMNIQSLLTFEFWTEDAGKCSLIWRDVLDSLELGAYVQDPTRGDMLN